MTRAPVAAIIGLALAGCSDGTLDLDVTDAPVDDADRIVIRFTGVDVERDDGEVESFDFSPPLDLDLLALTEGNAAALLDGVRVDDGTYTAVALRINATGNAGDSFVENNGVQTPLELLDANAGTLRLATSIAVERGERTALTVDFDMRKSVRNPAATGAPYELAPSLRLVQTGTTGALRGVVGAATAGASGCRPAVYVYTGHSVTPNDEGSALPPFASTRVRASNATFVYTIAFLPPGNYTAAFTCAAAADDPETDDATTFPSTANVTISEDLTTTHDFP